MNLKRGKPKIFSKNFRGKRGQVTIFIIIGIIIVAAAFLIYFFYPQIKSTIGIQEKNPLSFIQSCIEDDIKDAAAQVSLRGGSIAPENYIMYDDNKVEYLCYTEEFYANCVVQQPMLLEEQATYTTNKEEK